MKSSKLYRGIGIALMGLLVVGLATFANAQDADPIAGPIADPVIDIEEPVVEPIVDPIAETVIEQDTLSTPPADELNRQAVVLVVSDLNLTSVCSDDPTATRQWRIYNPNSFDVEVTWEVVGTAQTGGITAKAAGTGEPKWPGDLSGDDYTFFDTTTVGGANTTKIKWQDKNQQWKEKVKASGGEECPKPKTVDVVVQKIVCDDESDLPNWGAGTSTLTTVTSLTQQLVGLTQTQVMAVNSRDGSFSG